MLTRAPIASFLRTPSDFLFVVKTSCSCWSVLENVVSWPVLGRRVLALGRVREWFFRSAGCWGSRPVTLDCRVVPACPPGPVFAASWSSCR